MRWDECKHPRDEIGRFTVASGSRKMSQAKKLAELKRLYDAPAESLLVIDLYTYNSGAIAYGALDPNSKRADAHAERYYEEIRKRKYDVYKIAEHTGFPVEDIIKVKEYLFVDEHNLFGEMKRFFPNYDIAQSWQRLTQGNFVEADIILLNHELLEMELVSSGMSQDEAHFVASKKYNYKEAIDKWRINNGRT